MPKTDDVSEVDAVYASECCGEIVKTLLGYLFPPCSICDRHTAYVLLRAALQGELPFSA